MFPPSWHDRPIISTADSHGALEHPSRSIIGPGGVAVHEIYRYEFIESAQHEYGRQLDILFPDTQYYDKWHPREDLQTALTFADESHVACANRKLLSGGTVINCRMLARYQEYVVRFSTQVVPPYLTFEDLAGIFKNLDDKFASAVGARNP